MHDIFVSLLSLLQIAYLVNLLNEVSFNLLSSICKEKVSGWVADPVGWNRIHKKKSWIGPGFRTIQDIKKFKKY